ncbi:MAG: hypothetical protein LUF87_02115 [Alistipes sp.]|nr:hypothetical protein [Alistipes sp.]
MGRIKQIGDFEPTNELVALHRKAIEAIRFRKLIEPIVRQYQTTVLAKNCWMNHGEIELRKEFGATVKLEPVYDPLDIFKLSDEDRNEYLRQCRQEMEIHFPGKFSKDEVCALTYAKHEESMAIKELTVKFCSESSEFQFVNSDVLEEMDLMEFQALTDIVFDKLRCCFKYYKPESNGN